jgi:hypothetical protein
LTDQRLEVLASNPQTNWKTFMKVSDRPSEMFPQDLAKRGLESKHYADAGRKLRGVAGEMVVGEMELPGGLKITKSQVPTEGGSILDYQVREASGREALLEVKSWSTKQWQRQIDSLGGKGAEYIQGLFKQLDDAKASGKPVYLAVTNKLEKTPLVIRLREELASAGHENVSLVFFDETRLRDVGRELRKALAIAGGGGGVGMIVDLAINGEEDAPTRN